MAEALQKMVKSKTGFKVHNNKQYIIYTYIYI